ncbi:hypothetical protein [Pseudorhodoplanes sinuspersici]|nr:hypothetical protein [Pseudorhodoplanes sinuspersici]
MPFGSENTHHTAPPWQTPILAINFEDDELNPPELGILDEAMARLRNGRLVVIPAGPQSRGHYTALQASQWKSYLVEFMDQI